MADSYNSAHWLVALKKTLGILVFPGVATLAVGINAATTAVQVSGWFWLWPTSGNFRIQIGTEIMTVTAGHGTVNLTVTRAAVPAAHLAGVNVNWYEPIPTARIFEASAVLDVSTTAGQGFIQRIKTDGPALKFNFVRGRKRNNWHITNYELNVQLYFGVPQGLSQSLVDLLSLVELIKDLWYEQTSFEAGSPAQIIEMFWEEPEIDYLQDPAFGVIRMIVQTEM